MRFNVVLMSSDLEGCGVVILSQRIGARNLLLEIVTLRTLDLKNVGPIKTDGRHQGLTVLAECLHLSLLDIICSRYLLLRAFLS